MNYFEQVQVWNFCLSIPQCLLPGPVNEEQVAIGRSALYQVVGAFEKTSVALFTLP